MISDKIFNQRNFHIFCKDQNYFTEKTTCEMHIYFSEKVVVITNINEFPCTMSSIRNIEEVEETLLACKNAYSRFYEHLTKDAVVDATDLSTELISRSIQIVEDQVDKIKEVAIKKYFERKGYDILSIDNVYKEKMLNGPLLTIIQEKHTNVEIINTLVDV